MGISTLLHECFRSPVIDYLHVELWEGGDISDVKSLSATLLLVPLLYTSQLLEIEMGVLDSETTRSPLFCPPFQYERAIQSGAEVAD